MLFVSGERVKPHRWRVRFFLSFALYYSMVTYVVVNILYYSASKLNVCL